MLWNTRQMATGQGLFSSGSVADGYRQHLEPVIFRPWADRLIDFVGLEPDGMVLDVASGTGVVARAAAARVGAGGRVIASDISPLMLSHVTTGLDPEAAPVETLECSATDLRVADASIDVVLCQQGLPFIPDRVAAAREMRRVLRSGGRAGIAVWRSNPRIEPFIIYGETLQAHGVESPFPHAYDTSANSMSVDEVQAALLAAGFTDVEVTTEQLELTWPSPDAAALAVVGTPYGPVYAGLGPSAREQVMADLRRRMTAADGGATKHVMTAVLARGTAG
jgi:ubiquinone/menaquinone biosynthesis C-methylase UbiE